MNSAGISTASGIQDYRGKNGIYTLHKKKKAKSPMKAASSPIGGGNNDYNWLGRNQVKIWFPTLAHMCIQQLVSSNIVQYVISQNCDNLHLQSGIPKSKLAELHGNSFVETCGACGVDVARDFIIAQPRIVNMNEVRTIESSSSSCSSNDDSDRDSEASSKRKSSDDELKTVDESKFTGRQCEKCGGELQHTIINFGEKVEGREWKQALPHAKKADLMIVLGSSLKVRPAVDLVEIADKIVICNLQR